MKIFFLALVALSLTPAVYSADTPAENPAADVHADASEIPSRPAALEPKDAKSSVPVTAPPAAAALEAPASTVKPMGCVAHLQDLVAFHEKEIVSLKQMIDRWDSKMSATMKRKENLEGEVKTKLKKAETLQGQNTKASKKEADRIRKDVARINKDITAIAKELKSQCKELAGEIREVSKESQGAWKDTCQQAITDVQTAQN